MHPSTVGTDLFYILKIIFLVAFERPQVPSVCGIRLSFMAARAELLLGHGISAASGNTKQMLFVTHLRIFTDFKVKKWQR